MKPSEVIAQFEELFNDERRWCQGPAAMDARGRAVKVESIAACRWCLYGAELRALILGNERMHILGLARDAVWDAAEKLYGVDVVAVNESKGLPAVRRVLREARKQALRQEQG